MTVISEAANLLAFCAERHVCVSCHTGGFACLSEKDFKVSILDNTSDYFLQHTVQFSTAENKNLLEIVCL